MSQYDLPPQTLLQQSSARAVSGEELETYGKHAASLYGRGSCGTLNEAVVETVKKAGLAPEQVRRVVEFANTHAFLEEFKKEGTAKYVTFDGGPAEFNTVIQDLNDGGGGTVFDRGTLDYTHTPSVNVKTASVRGLVKTASIENEMDAVLAEAFSVDRKAAPLPYANPMGEVHEMRDKLSTARDVHTAEISEAEVDLMAVSEELYHHVKQAALDGTSLGSVVQAWQQALEPDPELVKAAFALISPRLQSDVFGSWDALGKSIEKTAGVNLLVNEKHPIIAAFGAYSDLVTKIAHLRESRQDVIEALDKLNQFERSVDKHYGEVIR